MPGCLPRHPPWTILGLYLLYNHPSLVLRNQLSEGISIPLVPSPTLSPVPVVSPASPPPPPVHRRSQILFSGQRELRLLMSQFLLLLLLLRSANNHQMLSRTWLRLTYGILVDVGRDQYDASNSMPPPPPAGTRLPLKIPADRPEKTQAVPSIPK